MIKKNSLHCKSQTNATETHLKFIIKALQLKAIGKTNILKKIISFKHIHWKLINIKNYKSVFNIGR